MMSKDIECACLGVMRKLLINGGCYRFITGLSEDDRECVHVARF